MSRSRKISIVVVALAVPLLLAACGGGGGDEAGPKPAVAEQVPGTDVTRVTLSPAAAERLGIRTTAIRAGGAADGLTLIPYSAVLYDPDGATWTYTSPKPLVFQRASIRVLRIDGDAAVLSAGPPVGTNVVTSGATEIWGVEYGGIEED